MILFHFIFLFMFINICNYQIPSSFTGKHKFLIRNPSTLPVYVQHTSQNTPNLQDCSSRNWTTTPYFFKLQKSALKLRSHFFSTLQSSDSEPHTFSVSHKIKAICHCTISQGKRSSMGFLLLSHTWALRVWDNWQLQWLPLLLARGAHCRLTLQPRNVCSWWFFHDQSFHCYFGLISTCFLHAVLWGSHRRGKLNWILLMKEIL